MKGRDKRESPKMAKIGRKRVVEVVEAGPCLRPRPNGVLVGRIGKKQISHCVRNDGGGRVERRWGRVERRWGCVE